MSLRLSLPLLACLLIATALGCGKDPSPLPPIPDVGDMQDVHQDTDRGDTGGDTNVAPQFAGLITGIVVTPDEEPLPTAIVGICGTEASPNERGRFRLPVPSACHGAALTIEAEGYAPAERAIDWDTLAEEGRVTVGAIFLTPTAVIGTVGPAGKVLGGPDEGVAIEVPPGAFPEDVTMTLALIPLDDPLIAEDFFPAPIPESDGFPASTLFGVIITAEGRQPAVALKVTLYGTAPLPPQTEVPVGRFSLEEGRWVDVGVAQAGVSSLTFETDHLSIFAGALPALPSEGTVVPDVEDLGRLPSIFTPGEPRVDARTGALQVGVEMPSLTRRGKLHGLTLFHDSRTVGSVIPLSLAVPKIRDASGPVAYKILAANEPRIVDLHPNQSGQNDDSDPAIGLNIEIEQDEEEPDSYEPDKSVETHRVNVTVAAQAEGVYHSSRNGSFTRPEPGAALENSGGAPVFTAFPVQVKRSRFFPTAIEDRNESPFGRGWHLKELTRLVQPQCREHQATLAGGFETPAMVFRRTGDLYVTALTRLLVEAGVDENTLEEPPFVARTANAVYVGIRSLETNEIWRVDSDLSVRRVAGGGEAEEDGACTATQAEGMSIRDLRGLSAHPSSFGVFFATQNCVYHLQEDGTLDLLMGSVDTEFDDEKRPGPGMAMEVVDFAEELMEFVGGPTDRTFYVNTYLWGAFIIRDRILQPMRPKVFHPGALVVAIDPGGEVYYSHAGHPCLYQSADGFNDPELFPTCLEGLPTTLEDGPAETARVGNIGAMAFDTDGNLWFYDATFEKLRRLTTEGIVETLGGAPASSSSTGSGNRAGGNAGNFSFGEVGTLGLGDDGVIVVGSPQQVLRLAPLPEATLVPRGAGDHSTLTRRADGSWLRVLENGAREHYSDRGLLLRRERPGEPDLSFVYTQWRTSVAEEACGRPAQLPLLQRIELGGTLLYGFSYNERRLSAITDGAGRRTSLGWSGKNLASVSIPGTTTQFTYDSQGRLLRKNSPGPGGSLATWQYTYGEFGVASIAIPGRGTRQFASAHQTVQIPNTAFSAAGVARHVMAAPAVATVPTTSGASTTITLAPQRALLTTPDGERTHLEFDEAGRVIRAVDPDGSTMRLARDEAGRILEIYNEDTGERWAYDYHPILGLPTRRVDPAGHQIRYHYDTLGRLNLRHEPEGVRASMQYAGNGLAQGMVTRIEDALGRRIDISYDVHGNAVKYVMPGGYTTDVTRDQAGRILSIEAPSGLVYSTTYDERDGVLSQTMGLPAQGRKLTYQRLVTNGWQEVGSHVPASAVLSLTDAEGRVWTYDRDLAMQLRRYETPASGEALQTFDNEGRRLSHVTADASMERFEWNDEGRMTRRSFTQGSAQGAFLEFTYDELGRVRIQRDHLRREERAFEPGFGWTMIHLTPVADDAVAAFILRRTSRTFGLLTYELGPHRLVLHRDFDEQTSRIQWQEREVQGSPQDLVVHTFDATRQIVAISRANGASTDRTFDEHGQVATQIERTPFATTTIAWTYDDAGRPASRTVNGETVNYTYDEFGFLTACSDALGEWSYDGNGARNRQGAKNYVRDQGGRLVDDGDFVYTYDAVGRRLSQTPHEHSVPAQTYVYGPGGHLSEVRHDGEVIGAYAYDGAGRRVRRTTDAGTWFYGYYPDSDRLARVVEPDGTEWFFAHGTRSAAFTVAMTEDGRHRYVHVDPYDRVVGISDESGVLSLVDEGCYGERSANSSSGDGLDMGLHGMLWDEESGLYYANARYYDPATGEFLTPDPEGIEAGPATYTYAGGNPIVFADPSGRFLFWVAAGTLLTGAAIVKGLHSLHTSQEARRTRNSYRAITDIDESEHSDASVEAGAKAHQRLTETSIKGGETAIEGVRSFVGAATDPSSSAESVLEAIIDEVLED